MQVKNSGAFKNDLITCFKIKLLALTIEGNVQKCTGFIFYSFPVVISISF